jgi:DNA-binding transcriptional MocR family regulator
LQLIEDLNLRALEIPTDPQEGIDLAVLQRALRKHAVRAAIFVANFHNPLGFLMSDEKKQAVVALLNARNIPIIEDDIYGELYFDASRPMPLKAFDRKGLVLYCASFSKSLAPGLRVGWVMPGQFLDRIKRYRLNQHISAPGLTHWALGRYLQTANYDRHLRRLRTQLKNQVSSTALAIARCFPPDTKITAPRGGVVLWVQLNEKVDSLELFRTALERRIAVFPGIICANSDTYRNYIRINCGMPYTDGIDRGIQTLAGIVAEMSR